MQNANASGTGGWAHTYDGTITPNGTFSASDGRELADYTGGGGTLNNGAGSGTGNTQLFWTADNPIITLFFDRYYTLDDILLETWAAGNLIPGTMTGFTASIGATSQAFATALAPTIVVNGQQASPPPTTPVPLPAGMVLISTSLGAFVVTRRRKASA